MCIGFCHVYICFFFRMESSKVEGTSALQRKFMTAKLPFKRTVQVYEAISNLYISLYAYNAIPKNKRLLLRLNKFSVWQPLKDLCFLTSMSVRMCNRNFPLSAKKKNSHSVYKKRRKSDLDKSIIIRIYDNCLLFIVH